MVREEKLELSRPLGHRILSPFRRRGRWRAVHEDGLRERREEIRNCDELSCVRVDAGVASTRRQRTPA
jgi:hypothetical protein